MKIKGKHVLLIIGFIFIITLIYAIGSSFYYSNLNFKPFFESENIKETNEVQNITYSLTNDNRILFAEKKDGKLFVNKMKNDNVDPVTVTSIDLKSDEYYDFYCKGKYAYLFYNNNLKIIDYDYYKFTDISFLPKGLIIVNQYNDVLYSYNDNILYKLQINEKSLTLSTNYVITNEIKNVKNVDFLTENEIVISTYNSEIFTYSLLNNKIIKITDIHSLFTIDNETLYYTYSYDSSNFAISYYNKNTHKTFKVKSCDYLTMQVKDDYMYLINKDEIYKVSIEREKRHETLQISSYDNITFNLSTILIENEKLMYLPMIKKENNNYTYLLYRYKR